VKLLLFYYLQSGKGILVTEQNARCFFSLQTHNYILATLLNSGLLDAANKVSTICGAVAVVSSGGNSSNWGWRSWMQWKRRCQQKWPSKIRKMSSR